VDKLTPQQRHKNMQHIRSKDTKIEIVLRKALWSKGYRYRKNCYYLPGKPDIAITKYKIAIFCDSEFFHGYQWEKKKLQLGTNQDYWIKKIERNILRAQENDKALLALGWLPVHFWGREILRHKDDCVVAVEDLIFELRRRSSDCELEDLTLLYENYLYP
jgi:DNA mismatch endonuclease (patch repair protein)